MTKTFSQGVDTQDLELDRFGNLKIVTDLEGLKQKVTSRLRLFKEEWFLDTSRGLPYLQEILTKGVEEGKIVGLISSEILKEPSVTSVINVSTVIDRRDRLFNYSATVLSEFGNFEVSV